MKPLSHSSLGPNIFLVILFSNIFNLLCSVSVKPVIVAPKKVCFILPAYSYQYIMNAYR